jgi:hypothetical protein
VKCLADGHRQPGRHVLAADVLAPGVYVVRAVVGNEVMARRMTVLQSAGAARRSEGAPGVGETIMAPVAKPGRFFRNLPGFIHGDFPGWRHSAGRRYIAPTPALARRLWRQRSNLAGFFETCQVCFAVIVRAGAVA